MDKTIFEQVYRDMLPGLYRLAQSMLRQTADAQDAVQQAAVSAWLSLERIRPGGERAYFTRIVINECRNIQRQRICHSILLFRCCLILPVSRCPVGKR